MPVTIKINCSHCGKAFEPTKKGHKYCSPTCSVYACKERKKQKESGNEKEQLMKYLTSLYEEKERLKFVISNIKNLNSSEIYALKKDLQNIDKQIVNNTEERTQQYEKATILDSKIKQLEAEKKEKEKQLPELYKLSNNAVFEYYMNLYKYNDLMTNDIDLREVRNGSQLLRNIEFTDSYPMHEFLQIEPYFVYPSEFINFKRPTNICFYNFRNWWEEDEENFNLERLNYFSLWSRSLMYYMKFKILFIASQKIDYQIFIEKSLRNVDESLLSFKEVTNKNDLIQLIGKVKPDFVFIDSYDNLNLTPMDLKKMFLIYKKTSFFVYSQRKANTLQGIVNHVIDFFMIYPKDEIVMPGNEYQTCYMPHNH